MGRVLLVIWLSTALLTGCVHQPREGKHLFILSGQSNMWAMNHTLYFTPIIENEFGADNVIIIKDSQGNEPIYKWYREWTSPTGEAAENRGELYDRLMGKVHAATQNQPIRSITFVWMQGETDARLEYGEVYEKSLEGLYRQLQKDMHQKNINFVIGRISDFDLDNKVFPHWTRVRDAQENFSKRSDRFLLVDTDDLNDNIRKPRRRRNNDLHCSPEGFQILGKRFAEASIELIRRNDD